MKILGPATPEEVAAAFDTRVGTTYERVNDAQTWRTCNRCKRRFYVSPTAWLFYGLCDPCFEFAAVTRAVEWVRRFWGWAA